MILGTQDQSSRTKIQILKCLTLKTLCQPRLCFWPTEVMARAPAVIVDHEAATVEVESMWNPKQKGGRRYLSKMSQLVSTRGRINLQAVATESF